MDVEGVQRQANEKTMLMLSQPSGMCIAWGYLNGVGVSCYMPVEWRSIFGYQQGPGVKRVELKRQSIDYVKNNFGITATEDECEAIAIGCAAYQEYASRLYPANGIICS